MRPAPASSTIAAEVPTMEMERAITLHASGREYTRDLRPRWLLHELDLPFTTRPVDIFRGVDDGYRAVNPTGKVPFLEHGEVRIFESGAILVYLADRFGDFALAPRLDDPDRGAYLQWIFFTQTTLEPPAARVFGNRTFLRARPGAAERAQEAQVEAESRAKILEAAVGGRRFLVGDRFTAADVMLGSTLFWLAGGDALSGLPALRAYYEGLAQRPAFQQATRAAS
ncbi:MAG: glutathione S-transferase family protein [Nannocystaceae bacterium]